MTLSGLDVGELGLLCRQFGRTRLSERTVRRLAHHTGGNPLLARALLAELTDEALKAAAGGFSRAPKSLAGLILPRLAALPRPAATWLWRRRSSAITARSPTRLPWPARPSRKRRWKRRSRRVCCCSTGRRQAQRFPSCIR